LEKGIGIWRRVEGCGGGLRGVERGRGLQGRGEASSSMLNCLGHPDRLDNLEDSRPDHNEHKQGNKFWADWVIVIFSAGLRDIASFRHVLCVLFVRFSHLWSLGHFGR